MAKVRGFSKIIFESDSQQLIKAILEPSGDISWKIEAFVNDIRMLSCNEQHLKFLFVKRSANKAANWVAKNACN